MPRKGQAIVGATLPEEWEVKLKNIVEKTGESKADFMKRILDNELAILENREYDLKYSVDNLLMKKVDRLLQKVDRQSMLFNSIKQMLSEIRSATLILMSRILKNFYLQYSAIRYQASMNKPLSDITEFDTIMKYTNDVTRKEVMVCLKKIDPENESNIEDYILKN